MDVMGPEPKRQRLEYNGQPQRMPPQPPPPPQSNSHISTLPPPYTYPPAQQPPPPPSPYDVGPPDPRSLPDPTGPHAYVQEHSGHSTPIREQRFHPDPNYSRRSSASAARSPDGHHQYPPGRSMSVVTIAEGQHYPPQYPTDSGSQPGYPSQEQTSNGNVNHGLPTHPYDQPHAYAPSHPVDYGHSPVTAGHPYGPPINPYGVSFGQQNVRPIKKGNRATQACDVCRTRKAKCDEGRPDCGFCLENGMKCNYQSVAPAKADRANQQIIDQLQSHKDDIKALKALNEGWGGRFDRLEKMIESISQGVPPNRQDHKPSLKMESPSNHPAADLSSALSNTVVTHGVVKEPSVNNDNPGTSLNSSGEAEALTNQSNAIYIEHDTAAQKLFRWRSIKSLLRQCKNIQFSDRPEDYVMDYETNKGVLRLYGKGRQMGDSGDGIQTSANAASPAGSSTSGPSDEASTTSSPAASPENLWGTGLTPSATEAKITSDIGGLNPDSTLKLDPKTITRLLKSYLDHMHILHPFLEERTLTKQVDRFKQRHDSHDSIFAKTSYVPSGPIDLLRENKVPKRKHSDGPYYMNMDHSAIAPNPINAKTQIDRSPETAKILLVMAIGRICEVRDNLPGPVPDCSFNHPPSILSPSGGRVDSPPPTFPMRHSPSSSSQSTINTSAPSPLSHGRYGLSSPRSSNGEILPGTRNLDVIPGLAYYAQASDILGNLTGYHDLVMAQCCLLAGLYAGQLANTLESLTWIQSACRICRLLVKKPSFHNQNTKESRRQLIKLTFWTSLQLESDILAELDIPPSGIQEVAEEVPYPKLNIDTAGAVNGEVGRPDIMQYYQFQLYLRRRLNEIQKELYKEKDPTYEHVTRSTTFRDSFVKSLDNWRELLPENLKWRDTDPEANNINDARLRGKYYGAQYIIHRPFLHAALDYDFEAPPVQSPPNDNSSSNTTVRPASGQKMGPPNMTPNYDCEKRRAETISLARICIEAAMHSTVAFDGVLDHRRLIVTNIMGTAHAQFGNLLVLSAAYKSKTLGALVPSERLDWLFNRTIKLLKGLSPISQTLAKDCQILISLKRVVFEGGDPDLIVSFSSDS